MEAVLGILREMNLEATSIRLGEVEVSNSKESIDFPRLEGLLQQNGFELLQDRELQIVEQLKTTIIKMIHYGDVELVKKNSVFLSDKLGLSYAYLSKLFSKQDQ